MLNVNSILTKFVSEVMKFTPGTDRGPRILDSVIPVADEEAPMSKDCTAVNTSF